jgi:hypothetical protein
MYGVYRRLLVLYPAPFRTRFGDEMEQVIADELRYGRLRWRRVFADLLGSAFVQRWEGPGMRTRLAAALFVVVFVAGGTTLVIGAGEWMTGGLFAAAMLAAIGVIYGVAMLIGRRKALGAEYDYGTRRFRWWWVPAAALGAFQVLMMAGQLIDDPKKENVFALCLIGAFSALVFFGMRISNRRRGNWMIATGVLPMLPFFWIVAPTVVALLVIVMALADNVRMSTPRPAV